MVINMHPEHREIIRQFHEHYYYTGYAFGGTWKQTYWMGRFCWKCPLDLWIYQEILHELRPEVIIELGTAGAGTTLFLAHMCDIIGRGRVITIDIQDVINPPLHPRISYLKGDSTSEEILRLVRAGINGATPVMAILDSDHGMDHVLRELHAYSEFVTAGSYLIVEDTNINGHPVLPDFGPGPMEATKAFLAVNSRFVIDGSREKFLMTQNPAGYLKKIADHQTANEMAATYLVKAVAAGDANSADGFNLRTLSDVESGRNGSGHTLHLLDTTQHENESPSEPSPGVRCLSCYTMSPPGSRFCNECGASVESPADQIGETQHQTQQPTVVPSQAHRSQNVQPARKLILKHWLSPGDIIMLTAAVRDLHLSQPGRFLTDVRTPCSALWENNPHITRIEDEDPEAEPIECEYPLINQSNQLPYHVIHGFRLFLQDKLGVKIEPHAFKGDIHISDLEKSWMSQVEETEGLGARFWIIVSGGKWDYTAKWWDPERAQQVVNHFQGRIRFVQCGEAGHYHPRLQNAVDLVGKTDLRQLVRLMYHADGVICPVTMFMHLAAAVETKPGRPANRPCIVVAGGREPSQWEAYPHHQYLHTNGALACCEYGGCWKSRVEPLGDGDDKDQSLCLRPVTLPSGRKLPECLDMITTADVIRSVENYLKFDPTPQRNNGTPV
jgi:cephalosporin hydroxylase/ADP-heptose:LPS heptosyltransferase